MAGRNSILTAHRRPWLFCGGAAFVLMIAVLVPVHWLQDHAEEPDAGTDCDVCLHLDGNPVDYAVSYIPAQPVVTGRLEPAPNVSRATALTLVPRGRAPPVVNPVT